MARGRMLSSTLGGSKKFAQLKTDTSRMIYMLLIPHTDAYGRVEADAVTLAGRVLTRLTTPIEEIEESLQDMERVGLIRLWEVDDDEYLEIVDFHEHNAVVLSREAQAIIPDVRGVLPPERPPRNTKSADAAPLVHSAEYIQSGIAAYESAKSHTTCNTSPDQVCTSGNTSLHQVQHESAPETVEENISEEKRREDIEAPTRGASNTPLQKTERPANEADRPEGPTAQPEQPDVRLTGIPEVDRYILDTRANAAPDPYKEQLDKILARKVDA